MKKYISLLSVFVIVSGLCIATAFAANKSQSFEIPRTVHLGTATIQPGDYDVSWSGTAPDVQVTIAKFNKVIATSSAKLTIEPNKYETIETAQQDSSETLTAIHLKSATLSFR